MRQGLGGALLATGLLLTLVAPHGAAAADVAEADSQASGSAVATFSEDATSCHAEQHSASGPLEAAALAVELEGRDDVTSAEVVDGTLESHAEDFDEFRIFQWGLDWLRMGQAWDIRDAEGMTIAVVDSGVDGAHPDLVDALVPGQSVLPDGGDGFLDESGHGTSVAGVAGATVGNGIGIAGAARGVELMPVRVMTGSNAEFSDVAAGICWAVDNGADVINLSLGAQSNSRVLADALRYANRRGVAVVASSGNFGSEAPDRAVYPAALETVIGVGAITQRNLRADFSSYGWWLDVVAPGQVVLSTCLPGSGPVSRPCGDGSDPDNPESQPYAYFKGTSYAAPFVAATAALLQAEYPRALPSQIAWRLRATAEDLGAEGFDPEYGHGLVDPVAALTEYPELGCRSDTGTVSRTWDIGRVQTAVAAACTHWPEAGVDEVVVATARDFPDALTGGALAASRGVPILLVEPSGLDPYAFEALGQLGVSRITIAGGTAAVPAEVAAELDELGFDVSRVVGGDRYDTAARLALLGGADAEEVILATGQAWPDAVAAGALLGAAPDTPVLLTRTTALPEATREALRQLDASRVTVIGGQAAISSGVSAELEALGLEVTRLSGRDRYETSHAVATEAATRIGGAPPLLIASGARFPDALAAGAVAGRVGGVVALTPPDTLVEASPTARLTSEGSWGRLEIVGGPSAVSLDVQATLKGLLGN